MEIDAAILAPVLPESEAARLRANLSARMSPEEYRASLVSALEVAVVETIATVPRPQNWKDVEAAVRVLDRISGFSEARSHALKLDLVAAQAKAAAAAPDSGLVNVTPTVRRAAPVDVPAQDDPPAFD